MVQMDIFFNKKYCLKSYSPPLKLIDLKKAENSNCEDDMQNCGGICINSELECPVNSLELLTNANA